MERMTRAICGVNVSCYDSSSAASSGGAPQVDSAQGAEGAGNIEKRREPEASLRCLPQLAAAAVDCGKALLLKNMTGALVCGLKLEALRQCLKGDTPE